MTVPVPVPRALALAVCLAMAGAMPEAHAALASTQLQVRAVVLPTCVVNATDLDFGTYTPGSPAGSAASATVTTTCSLLTTFRTYADGGLHHAAGSRRMSNGASHHLAYGLYRDPMHTVLFGTLALPIEQIGTGLPQSLQLYGTVPANQNVPPGSYSDTLTINVDF